MSQERILLCGWYACPGQLECTSIEQCGICEACQLWGSESLLGGGRKISVELAHVTASWVNGERTYGDLEAACRLPEIAISVFEYDPVTRKNTRRDRKALERALLHWHAQRSSQGGSFGDGHPPPFAGDDAASAQAEKRRRVRSITEAEVRD